MWAAVRQFMLYFVASKFKSILDLVFELVEIFTYVYIENMRIEWTSLSQLHMVKVLKNIKNNLNLKKKNV